MSSRPIPVDASNSTNVRFPSATLIAAQGLRLLASASPSLAARTAARLFFTAPARRHPTTPEAATLVTARREDVVVQSRRGRHRLATWTWGDGGPIVLLVHGWGGNGSQLHAFVPELLAGGFRPVAIDFPGHGASAGVFTSLPEWSDALLDLAAQLGGTSANHATNGPAAPGRPATRRAAGGQAESGRTATGHATAGRAHEPGEARVGAAFPGVHGVIAHSFGAAATTLALDQGLAAARVALLAPVAHPVSYFDAFMALVTGDEGTQQRAREAAEARLDFTFGALAVPYLAARQSATALVVHDAGDRETPLAGGVAIARAWPQARLVTTQGLGHRRLLADPGVVDLVLGHLRAGLTPSARCANPGCGRATETPDEARCPSCTLEHELAHPELRWVAA